ncbi:PIN domain-containing protein [Sulfitobacter sp. M57]|uniref:RSP_2648 family PIN domain-containing protein n=1 Tax=unclassified Sulfitobacter TaxID=196795 RepID=UPI0023E19B42|nr:MULTISPECIES: PIN domain-containing protein [unclassified Sulfitobacter]MDF3413605.1 PIN domain-containing protein [Sulfitobacter sp. KE5]MDF3421113.1 PIN domain-containing protein [Sulfitobacter sp. KE43]MDF3432151.1 PIN domain-containing protein [Sulfitobacter sp. KE42]MDF3457791.1 PIN domain-containing protein [Sulfitobacter sp. S74]MDF3461692.1 PIN domain-containing protein [Sulfitobacter sp. Ks18]
MVPRILIDTCVLYPTVMREVVMGAAKAGLFQPVWSERILEEWARAAIKLGPTGEVQARSEIAMLRAAWPAAERPAAPQVAQRLWLPDADDIHVLAVAVDSSADMIMTLNAKDFPRDILAEEDLTRIDPDSFLHQLWLDHPEIIAQAADDVLATARKLSGKHWELRALLKKARLPRLAKALSPPRQS